MWSLTERAKKIATPTLANALDDFGLSDRILPSIKQVALGMHFAGPAVTVQETVGDYGTYTHADFQVGSMIDAASAGDIIVVAANGANVSTFGGMASFAAKKKGVAGLLADVGIRDLEEIIAFKFPVFAKHLTPLTGRTRIMVEKINVAVVIDGVLVEPGDLIVADGTGVVVLPVQKAEGIIKNAEQYDADDKAAIKELKAGLTFTEVMTKFTRI
ncbi:MAG: aspartate aminotransferase [Magnetovibrio sp.]|nr:aspartate aminotransferase [Magnetovibrio sp.]